MVSMNKALDARDSSVRGPDLRLFFRDVRDRQGRKRAITVRSWSTIKDVKDAIQQIIHVPPSMQRLYFGPLLTSGGELPNHRTLQDAGIYRSGDTVLLDIKNGASGSPQYTGSMSSLRSSMNDICVSSSMLESTPKALKQLIQQARRGLTLGLKPELVLDGSGGTYFLHDARKVKVAVFKPADEEPYAENNPRGYVRQAGEPVSLREGVVPGESCIREVAAYLLDHGGFSGVPMTTLAEARHPAFNMNGARLKVSQGGASVGNHSINPSSPTCNGTSKKPGSFQEYISAECTMDDMSPSRISADEVHKIAILDIRIMNADRNSANLLCRRKRDGSLELIPIDHGYCLRSVCDVSWMDWCWLDWPQLKQPLSEKCRKFILEQNIEADARMLRERLNLCQEAIDYFRASSRLLQAGIKAGLTLYEIAIMCCRNDNLGEIPSKLEILMSMASELASSAVVNGRWHHTAASRALTEQLSPKGGTLLASNEQKAARLQKSASSAYFASFLEASSTFNRPLARNDMPGMTSSISDSSSDGDDAAIEREECDEWAASLIAGVSMLQSQRSVSVDLDNESTDTELSSSPKGFWHIRPCMSPSIASDDESICWSPQNSSKPTVEVSLPPMTLGPRVTFASEETLFRLPSVSFADSWAARLSPMPTTTKVAPAANENDIKIPDDDYVVSLERQDSGGMVRSKSYTALSSVSSSLNRIPSPSKMDKPIPGTRDYEQFRDYFQKFVDLVIVRETTAAAQLSLA